MPNFLQRFQAKVSGRTLSSGLAASVEMHFPGKYFEVAQGHFLVNATGTSQEIAIQLNILNGGIGRAIVYNIGGYFGYGPNTAWEWLKANMTTGGAGG